MRQARKDAKIPQKEAAHRMNMQPSELSRIENGDPRARPLRAPELVIAAQMYNRSVDWLLGLSERPYLRPDLAWRLGQLPSELAARLIETPIYALHEFLELHKLLPQQTSPKKKS